MSTIKDLCCRVCLVLRERSSGVVFFGGSCETAGHQSTSRYQPGRACCRAHQPDVQRLPSRRHQNLKDAIAKTGRKLSQYQCDVKTPKELRACYQKIWSDGHKADILLNCAGVQRRAEAADFTDEEIELVLDVNIKATLVSCQEFAKPLLAEGRPGKVINIASIISVSSLSPIGRQQRGRMLTSYPSA